MASMESGTEVALTGRQRRWCPPTCPVTPASAAGSRRETRQRSPHFPEPQA
jgi:hypothetical protein